MHAEVGLLVAVEAEPRHRHRAGDGCLADATHHLPVADRQRGDAANLHRQKLPLLHRGLRACRNPFHRLEYHPFGFPQRTHGDESQSLVGRHRVDRRVDREPPGSVAGLQASLLPKSSRQTSAVPGPVHEQVLQVRSFAQAHDPDESFANLRQLEAEVS